MAPSSCDGSKRLCSFRAARFATSRSVTLRCSIASRFVPGRCPPTSAACSSARVGEPRHRHFLAKYVRTLWQFAPPLYCGETGNLRNRSREHVTGETGFGRRVLAREVPPWRDLELGYLILGDARADDDLRASQRRRLLEVVATSLLVAGYVDRRG